MSPMKRIFYPLLYLFYRRPLPDGYFSVLLTTLFACNGSDKTGNHSTSTCTATFTFNFPNSGTVDIDFCARHDLEAQFEFDPDDPPEIRQPVMTFYSTLDEGFECTLTISEPSACGVGYYLMDGSSGVTTTTTLDCENVPDEYEGTFSSNSGYLQVTNVDTGTQTGNFTGIPLRTTIEGYLNVTTIEGIGITGMFSLSEDIVAEDAEEVECITNDGDIDNDGDIATVFGGTDCNDNDPNIEGLDSDNDGVSICDDDCDDNDPITYPSATEICDYKDNDCDNQIDETALDTFFLDSDNDGYGDPTESTEDCSLPENYVENNLDCDDDNPQLNQDDDDNDGSSTCDGDCDDNDPITYPSATEICDDKDNDCDNQIDETALGTFFLDSDNDGYGDPTESTEDCSLPGNYVENNLDCNDNNPQLNQDDDDNDGSSTCDGDCNDNDSTLNLLDEDGDSVSTCDGDMDDYNQYQITNSSLSFNGSSSRVDIPDGSFFINNTMTVEAWVYPNSFSTNSSKSNVVSTDEWQGSGARGFVLGVGTGFPFFKIGTIDGWQAVYSVSSITLNQWHHIAGIYDNETVLIYVDGVLKGTELVSAISSPNLGLCIGDNVQLNPSNASVSRYFNGDIDTVRISSITRYTSNFNPDVSWNTDIDTLGLWDMNIGSGTTVYDNSGNANHGATTDTQWSQNTVQ